MKKVLYIASALILAGCSRVEFSASSDMPDIFPDYIGVTVPETMTDLPFRMSDGREFKKETVRKGDTLWVEVKAWKKGERTGVKYSPFPVAVSSDPIDPYIAYRLIEPGYESWNQMGIYQRELGSFKEKAIVTNEANGKGCVNCHTFSGGDPGRMLFHARGAGGGTVFVDGKSIKLINLATVGPHKQGTYPAWNPDGRYVAFSSNSTHQSFSIKSSQPIEVYDTASDIILMDLQTDSVYLCPAMTTEGTLETFPSWSSDGRTLYYCAADTVSDVARERAELHYRLMSIGFEGGSFTGEPKTVWQDDSASVSLPRACGDWLLMTVSDFATFPIWHQEADLQLMDLRTGEVRKADELNSDDTESYHSWSSNGRWVIFSSRRLDGRYTRLYIAHFDGEGHFGKPFLLPQKDPDFNTLRLKSYNIPEFIKGDASGREREFGKLFHK